jgi:hypothetical protein
MAHRSGGSGPPGATRGVTVLASSYPLLNLFWTMLTIFLFIVWIWLLIAVFVDLFSHHDMNGWVKALWVLFVFVLPIVGIIAYLLVHGQEMAQRSARRAAEQDKAAQAYIRQAASSGSTAEELAKLGDLHRSGALNDAEFEQAKAKLLV